MIWGIVIVGILAFLYYLIKDNGEKYSEEEEEKSRQAQGSTDADNVPQPSNEREPMQILISSLRELNADYKVDRLKDGDEVIYFMFQAENFSLQVSPDCYFCHMIDPVWYSFDVSDFNELALVKRVINDMNWVSPLNVVYTKSSDEKLYEINTTYNLFVDDSIPYPSYLYKVINDFFITKNTFFRMLAEEHGKEVSDKE
jgi:hypothetical protein